MAELEMSFTRMAYTLAPCSGVLCTKDRFKFPNLPRHCFGCWQPASGCGDLHQHAWRNPRQEINFRHELLERAHSLEVSFCPSLFLPAPFHFQLIQSVPIIIIFCFSANERGNDRLHGRRRRRKKPAERTELLVTRKLSAAMLMPLVMAVQEPASVPAVSRMKFVAVAGQETAD